MPMHRLITKSHRRHGCIPVDVWALYYNQDFYNLLCVLSGGGNGVDKTADLAAGLPGDSVRAVAASVGQRVNVITQGPSTVVLGHSDDNAVTWSEDDTLVALDEVGTIQIGSDRTNRDLVFAINDFGILTDTLRDALRTQVSLSGIYGPLAAASYVSWFTDGKPLYIWCSTDGGVTYSSVRLDWLMQVLPTRLMNVLSNYGGVSYTADCVDAPSYTRTPHDPACDPHFGPGRGVTMQNDSSFWMSYWPTGTWTIGDNVWGYAGTGVVPDAGIYVDSTGPGEFIPIEYQVVTSALNPPARGDLIYFPPGGSAFLCPRHDGAGAYVLTAIGWFQDVITQPKTYDENSAAFGITEYVSPLAFNQSSHFPPSNHSNYMYKIESDLSYTRQSIFPGQGISQAVPDPTDTDAVFTIDFDGILGRYNWGANAFTNHAIPIVYGETGVFVTSQGTVLVGDSSGLILRSTDRGVTWTSIDVSALTSYPEFFTGVAEYGGTLGSSGIVVLASSDNDGTFLFSLDDGASWAKTADIASHDYPESVAAR
jgi:hypothetical protein